MKCLTASFVLLILAATCLAHEDCTNCNEPEIEQNSLGIAAKVAIGAAAGVVAVAAAPAVLTAVGFGGAGVVAGSFAASIQAYFYGGAATGVFAICQSVGVTGIALSTKAMIGTAVGGAVATFTHYFYGDR